MNGISFFAVVKPAMKPMTNGVIDEYVNTIPIRKPTANIELAFVKIFEYMASCCCCKYSRNISRIRCSVFVAIFFSHSVYND